MEVTLDQALQKGIKAHRAGKVQEADRYYTAILRANPKHPDANHNMGVLAIGVGKVEEALPFFKTALDANPNVAQFWLSHIDALVKLDRMDQAQAVLQEAKQKGAKGDAFDQLEKRLGSFNSRGSTLFQSSIKSLKDHINTFYTGLRSEVLNAAAKGWLYDLKFDQNFLARNEEINLHTKINNSKNASSYKSQKQNSAFKLETIAAKLNEIEDLGDKFHTLDCLNTSESKLLFADSFSESNSYDFQDIQNSAFKKNKLNVVIIGAGPCGLYLSNALKYQLTNKINILVLDNHCDERHFKKPFSRRWLTHLPMKYFEEYFDDDVGKLAGGFGTDGYIGLPINLIETLLLISSKKNGVKFYFDHNFDYSDFNNSLVDLIFDASGGRMQNINQKMPSERDIEIEIPNVDMNFGYAGTKNLPIKNLNSNGNFSISLKEDGYYHYPHFNENRIFKRMMKLTHVPISMHPNLMEFVRSLNNNRFYIWKGMLASEINQLLVIINLTITEYNYLKPIISDMQLLNIDLVGKALASGNLGSDLMDFFKLCAANHDGQICMNSPFVSMPMVNLTPLDKRINGVEVYPVGDSLFQGNPKVGNGLGRHLNHIKKLVSTIASHQT